MIKKVFLVIFLVLLSVFLWSFFIEPSLLTENIETKSKWPSGAIKIAFFSDLHGGAPHINKSYIKNLVQRINNHKPDIVLIGGDLVINGVVGGQYMDIADISNILADLVAPLGKFVVLGNHDWWDNAENIKSVLQQKGFIVLENESRLIELANKQKFNLVGIGDRFTDHSDPVRAFSNISNKYPSIVFMHDPASIFEIKHKFFLSLAGHMHGGQVFVPGIGALVTPGVAPKSWAKGWTNLKFGSLYVSQGVGTSILPIRFNSPPEFVILNLN